MNKIGCLNLCGRIAAERGLCRMCKYYLRKQWTWAELEERGLAVPPKKRKPVKLYRSR